MIQGIQACTRFNVVGSSGSGKSTFSRHLAEALGLDYLEIDAIFWKPNWTQPTDKEFLADLKDALSGDCWVVDGNYSRTVPIKWARVQVVIWLDLPYWQIMYQVIKRTLRRSLTQQELWSGNRETLAKGFLSKDSVILWSLTNLSRVRKGYEAAMNSEHFQHIQFIRLRSRSEVQKFLKQIEQAQTD